MNTSRLQDFDAAKVGLAVSLKYVNKGLEQYHINGVSQPVQTGQFLLVNQGSDVRVRIKRGAYTEGMCMFIQPQDIADALQAVKQPQQFEEGGDANAIAFPEQVFPADAYALGGWAKALFRQAGSLACADTIRLSLAEQLAKHIQRSRAEQAGIQVVRKSTQEELYRRVLRGQAYLRAHMTESLSVAEVAREAGMSEFHFFRAFRKAFGQTPHQYLTHSRLEKAKDLLETHQYTSTEIAVLSGFADASHFGKVFRKAHGMSPKQWVQRGT